jgi:hypothetical protein
MESENGRREDESNGVTRNVVIKMRGFVVYV